LDAFSSRAAGVPARHAADAWTHRRRGRAQPLQYHLLEPLLDDERLATCELALAAGSARRPRPHALRLAREGLVERVPCAQAGVVHVILTDDGARVLRQRGRGEAQAEIFASLSAGSGARRACSSASPPRSRAAVKPTPHAGAGGAALAYSLAQTMVIPALPSSSEFHAGPADATRLLTAFLLTSSIATPLLGRLATCTASTGCSSRWPSSASGRSSRPSPAR
jgi:hypothetical protein